MNIPHLAFFHVRTRLHSSWVGNRISSLGSKQMSWITPKPPREARSPIATSNIVFSLQPSEAAAYQSLITGESTS